MLPELLPEGTMMLDVGMTLFVNKLHTHHLCALH